jgi:hypothetical protein
VRYLEFNGFNNAGAGKALLTLTMQVGDETAFTTSDVLGLSAEFTREIRTDARATVVKVNGITAECGKLGGDCHYAYSALYTPVVASIVPKTSISGVTLITITGSGFSKHTHLNTVDFGGSPCDVSLSNSTFLICTVPRSLGTAGTFHPVITVFNRGCAHIPSNLTHTIALIIDKVTPLNGSMYGGMTLTITGSGFGRFGLFNQITLNVHNASSKQGGIVRPIALQDEDDWQFGRGKLVIGNTSARFENILCIPKTLKNRACRYTALDSGSDCTITVGSPYAGSAALRDVTTWYDFSTPEYIECVVEALAVPLRYGMLASVEVTVVDTSVLTDVDALAADVVMATKNFNCVELGHCMMLDS